MEKRISMKISRFHFVHKIFGAGTIVICLYIWCRLNNWCYDWSWLAPASAPPSQKSRHNPTFGPICPTITTNKYFSEELKVFIKINLPYKVLQLFSGLQKGHSYCKDFGYLFRHLVALLQYFCKYEYISKNCQIVNILQTSWRTEGRVWMTDFKEVSVEVHNVAFKVSFRRKKVKFKWKSIPPTCLQRKDKSRIQIAQMAWHET